MTFLDDGACELTEMTPGSGAFVSQINANFAQVNAQSAALIKVRAGETIPPKTFVAIDSISTGKLVKAQPQTDGKHRCIGMAVTGGNTDDFVTVQIGGVFGEDLGEGAGAVYYLQNDGGVDPSPYSGGT